MRDPSYYRRRAIRGHIIRVTCGVMAAGIAIIIIVGAAVAYNNSIGSDTSGDDTRGDDTGVIVNNVPPGA